MVGGRVTTAMLQRLLVAGCLVLSLAEIQQLDAARSSHMLAEPTASDTAPVLPDPSIQLGASSDSPFEEGSPDPEVARRRSLADIDCTSPDGVRLKRRQYDAMCTIYSRVGCTDWFSQFCTTRTESQSVCDLPGVLCGSGTAVVVTGESRSSPENGTYQTRDNNANRLPFDWQRWAIGEDTVSLNVRNNFEPTLVLPDPGVIVDGCTVTGISIFAQVAFYASTGKKFCIAAIFQGRQIPPTLQPMLDRNETFGRPLINKQENSTCKVLVPDGSLNQRNISDGIEFGAFPELRFLALRRLNITGSLPDLTGLPKLEVLALEDNLVEDSLASLTDEFQLWSKLEFLFLSSNDNLKGTIPESIGQLKSLRQLRLDGSGFIGPLPASLWTLVKLQQLSLQNNALIGELPAEIGNLVNLERLQLQFNQFTGVIPADVQNMTKLWQLRLHNNNLTGPLPAVALFTAPSLEELDISDNNLGPMPPQLPLGSADNSGLQFLNFESCGLRGDSSTLAFIYSLDPLDTFRVSSGRASRAPVKLDNNEIYGEYKFFARRRNSQTLCSVENPSFCPSFKDNYINSISLDVRDAMKDNVNYTLAVYNVLGGNCFGNYTVDGMPGPLNDTDKQKFINNSRNIDECNKFYEQLAAGKGGGGGGGGSNRASIIIGAAIGSFGVVLIVILLVLLGLAYRKKPKDEPLQPSELAKLLPKGITMLTFSEVEAATHGFALVLGTGGFGTVYYGEVRPGVHEDLKDGARVAVKRRLVESRQGQRELLNEINVLSSIARHRQLVNLLGVCIEGSEQILLYEFVPNWTLKQHLKAKEVILNAVGPPPDAATSTITAHTGVSVGSVVSAATAVSVPPTPPTGASTATTHGSWTSLRRRSRTSIDLRTPWSHPPLSGTPSFLSWDERLKIMLGAARGISYLHFDIKPAVIHRDIKTANILLDDNLDAKVADFGIIKLSEGDSPGGEGGFSTTFIRGTPGYLDIEYWATNNLTLASDVYSFGVTMMAVFTGREPIDPSFEHANVVEWVRPYLERASKDGDRDSVEAILDLRLAKGSFSFPSVMRLANLIHRCIMQTGKARPTMREVVTELEHATEEQRKYKDAQKLAEGGGAASVPAGPNPDAEWSFEIGDTY